MAYKKPIDPSIIYTCKDGDYRIIEDYDFLPGQTNRDCLIEFLDTGNRLRVQLANAKRGNVRDREKRNIVGQVFHSNHYSDFVVLEKLGVMGGTNTMNRIRFLATGYEMNASTTNIMTGNVKDPFYPSIHGVGYLGCDSPKDKNAYTIWVDMLRRCYGGEERYTSYANVTVCSRWHCYANFEKDIHYIPGYNEFILSKTNAYGNYPTYALDKDFLQLWIAPGQPKVYSPETCCFIPPTMNTVLTSRELAFPLYAIASIKGFYKSDDINGKTIIYVRPILNGVVYDFGEYDDLIAACNVYNNKMRFYGFPQFQITDVPYMPPEEIAKHRVNAQFMRINDQNNQ